MVTEAALIKKFLAGEKSGNRTRTVICPSIKICKINNDRQIMYGEVYAPEMIDSHGEAMDAESVEELAHSFLLATKNRNIDTMHNNKPIEAAVVESFIARANDPDYTEGAWVVGTKIFDEEIWQEIKKGKYNGYSMEAWVQKETRTVEIRVLPMAFGFTEENDGHVHAYYVEVDDDGRVLKGWTSEDAGHSHEIHSSSATDFTDDHAHRYFLP